MFSYACDGLVVYDNEKYCMASQMSKSIRGNCESSSYFHANITIIKINDAHNFTKYT